DPARRNHQSRGIDLAPGRSLFPADPGNPAIRNGNVAANCGLAGAVDDLTAANNDVVHAILPGVAQPRPRRSLLLLDEYRLTAGREGRALNASLPRRHTIERHGIGCTLAAETIPCNLPET